MALPRIDKQHRALTPDEEQERRRSQREKNQAAIDLIDRLMNVDAEEAEDQRQTLEFLRHVLHEDYRVAEAQPVQAFPGGGQNFVDDDLTEEEALAEQARRLDRVVEALINVSEEEAEEQRETWEYLRHALNEDRRSARQRVP